MTSFIIKAHEGRAVPAAWKSDPDCPFCKIVSGEAPAYRVYEDDKVVAFLDIAPLRRGHTLIIPKTHISRVSELPPEFAAAVGATVSKVANALTRAINNTGLNVVCNQEYAQAVFHVHYHVIPAPINTSGRSTPEPAQPEAVDHVEKPISQKEMYKLEFQSRYELGDEEARDLVTRIRAKL